MSVGIETFGRTSYVFRFPEEGFVFSLELASNPVGVVALLEIEERADEASSISVVMDDAMEPRALSGRRCAFPCDANLE